MILKSSNLFKMNNIRKRKSKKENYLKLSV